MGPLDLLLLILVLLSLIGAGIAIRATSGMQATVSGRLADVARDTRRWRVGGLLIGLLVAGLTLGQGGLGRGVLLAAPLFGLCSLLGVVIGELQVEAPGGETRSATLQARRVRDYLPTRLAVVVSSTIALLVMVATMTTAIGSAYDPDRAGRSLARACGEQILETRDLWPGSFYTGPLAIVVLVGLAVAGTALRRIVSRPRPDGESGLDDTLRRHAATAVTAAVGLLVAVPLAGISLVAADRLLGICNPPLWWTIAGWGLALLTPLVVGIGIWCAAALVLPGRVSLAASARQ